MDKHLEHQINIRLDEITSSVHNIDKTLARQEEQLSFHIKRTNLLEEAMKPVEKHVAMVSGALKFVGFLSLLLGIVHLLTHWI